MARGLKNAKGELGPTGLALQGLGVNFRDANGNILPTTDILTAVADKLAAMPDGLEKTQLMMDVFGKSGKDLSDVMGALTTEGFAAADEKAKALGLSMGESGVDASLKLGRSLNDVKMMGQGLMVTLGSELMPVIQPLISQFVTWAISVMPQVREGIKTVVDWVMTSFIPALKKIWEWLTINLFPVLATLVNWLMVNIPPAVETVRTIIEKVINFLRPFVEEFISGIQKFWAEHGEAILAKAKEIWDAIVKVFEWFKGEFTKIFDAFKLAFSGDWEGFGKKLREVWDEAWAKIKEIGQNVWNAIKKFFTETDWGAVGRGILEGIAAGLNAGINFIKDAIIAVINAAIAAAKGFLGIHSPSLLFGEIGQQMMAGMAVGIRQGAMAPAMAVQQAAAGTIRAGNTYQYYLTANYGYQSESSLADDVRMLAMLAR